MLDLSSHPLPVNKTLGPQQLMAKPRQPGPCPVMSLGLAEFWGDGRGRVTHRSPPWCGACLVWGSQRRGSGGSLCSPRHGRCRTCQRGRRPHMGPCCKAGASIKTRQFPGLKDWRCFWPPRAMGRAGVYMRAARHQTRAEWSERGPASRLWLRDQDGIETPSREPGRASAVAGGRTDLI